MTDDNLIANDASTGDEFAEVDLSKPEGEGQLRADKDVDREAVVTDRNAHPSTDPAETNGSPASPAFMIGMLRWHPFMAFFLFQADCNFPRSMPPHERFKGTRVLHPWLHRTCLIFDFLLMILMVAFLSWIVVVIANSALA